MPFRYDDYSTMPPLISEEEMDEMPSCDKFDNEPMSKEMTVVSLI